MVAGFRSSRAKVGENFSEVFEVEEELVEIKIYIPERWWNFWIEYAKMAWLRR